MFNHKIWAVIWIAMAVIFLSSLGPLEALASGEGKFSEEIKKTLDFTGKD